MVLEFLQKICSLDNICQWAERDSAIKESVSQHSFKVSAFCIFLLNELHCENAVLLTDNQEWVRFRKDCVEYAVLHDFDEAILGRDISHAVKYNRYNGDKIRQDINDFVDFELKRLGLGSIKCEVFPNVKTFVKMCDWLSLLTFIYRNEALGCSTFVNERKYCCDKITESFSVVQFMLKDVFSLDNFSIFVTLLNEYVWTNNK